MMVTSSKIQGQHAENQACAFLKTQGLQLIEQNFSCPSGELDLIMKDQQTIVFVEVRFRHSPQFGSVIETITPQKRRKLIHTALLFLQKKKWLHKLQYRFDIIGLDTTEHIHWIKNAFYADHYC